MNIRNFCIIAHIDHGKSTLADRMLEITKTIHGESSGQMLDTMELEQERGITIKLTPARMQRKDHELNLIDTPGHADFQYEVSRSLTAVEWVILLVDAAQWVQAQTLSTLYMAIDQWLEIIPVLNKVDLPAANPERVGQELEQLIGINQEEIIKVSAKTWLNVDHVLDAIIERIDNPVTFADKNAKKFYNDNVSPDSEWLCRALIFDSVYDKYKGVVSYVKVIDGQFIVGEKVQLVHSETTIVPPEVGYLNPTYQKGTALTKGQIGYIVTGKKSVRDAQIGDTMVISSAVKQTKFETKQEQHNFLTHFAIPGFQKAKPFVYAGVYPIETSEYDRLKENFEKLTLNDSAIEFEPEVSKALGFGFRCGFLGMLHMDIIKERLSREYDSETIFTTPTVSYIVKVKNFRVDDVSTWRNITILIATGLFKHIISDFTGILTQEQEEFITTHTNDQIADKYGEQLRPRLAVRSWGDMPNKGDIDEIFEPYADVEIVGPEEFAGRIMELVGEYRGEMKSMDYLDQTRVVWRYQMPIGEIIIDFYDRLKSSTKWYGTMNYDFRQFKKSELVKLDILINGECIEAFSLVIHKDKAYNVGSETILKLKELIPKHMFTIPLQAAIGTKIIARETIGAMKKDVIAKCYGWDISRKKKLLKKQKEGKKRMKEMGNVSVPGDIFMKMVTRE